MIFDLFSCMISTKRPKEILQVQKVMDASEYAHRPIEIYLNCRDKREWRMKLLQIIPGTSGKGTPT
jgi:hypothetical protein